MFGEDCAYAVARIRVLETGLQNQAAIEQLLACQDGPAGAFRSLTEKRAGETVILGRCGRHSSPRRGKDLGGDHGFAGSGPISRLAVLSYPGSFSIT